MCLSKVTWLAKSLAHAKSRDKWQKGYKIFEALNGNLKFPYKNRDQEIVLNTIMKAVNKKDKKVYNEKTGIWETKKNQPIMIQAMYDEKSRTFKSYLAGFHIFPAKMAALHYSKGAFITSFNKLCEVEYRKVTAEGEHNISTTYPADCIIAQEMRIIREIEWEDFPNAKPTQHA